MSTGAAMAQVNHDVSHDDASIVALPCPVSASVAHLKVNGTAIVAILAASKSHIVTQTRSRRSRRSEGQIYGHSPTMILKRLAPPSTEISRFKARVDRSEISDIHQGARRATDRA